MLKRILPLLIVSYSFAQPSEYARKIVDTLASSSMHGRGYVNNGDKIAANFIATEFKKMGLHSFTSNYFQNFNLPVNIFPKETHIEIVPYQKVLKPGIDYIIGANSPSVKNSTKNIIWIDSIILKNYYNNKETLSKQFTDCWLVIDEKQLRSKEQKQLYNLLRNEIDLGIGIITFHKKLTWTVSQTKSKRPSIDIISNDSIITYFKKSGAKLNVKYDEKFIAKYTTQNVISYIKGSQYPDSFILFTAHYDHLGQMGKDACFYGANDNASGCAMMLSLAKYYSENKTKPKYSIIFIAFGAEEAGLVGSKYFTENPCVPLPKIRFVMNCDLMGTGEDGITVVNATEFKKEFDSLLEINKQYNYLTKINPRGKAANSDHYFFSEKGVPAFFIYTMGGITAYHDVFDKPETLPLTKFNELHQLIIKFIESF